MDSVRYRDALPADAELLAELGRRSFTETFGHLYRPDDLAAFLLNHSEAGWQAELADPVFAVCIAEADEEPVGYAKLGPPSLPFRPDGPSMELRQLYVLAPWQGSRVARELMDWVIAGAKARGAEALYLSVFVDNHRARRFYERYGFRFVGTYDFMVGSHADVDHVLRLDLKDAS